ncbi:MAG TPA: DUF4230 domain-containing protein [Acidobacteriaceae bacterium]|jgi:hypothetical protein|nr:DUF4230 domain-containing protein [Acidobacteriaceae bacterium]
MPATIPQNQTPRNLTSVRRRSTAFPALVLGIILGLLVALVAIPAAVRHVGASMRNRISMAFLGRHDTIDISQPTVIASIQRLARLESVVYTMDKVVEGNRSSEYLPDILTGDKILMIVHGQAVAGVDLSNVQAGNVQIDGRSVTITMPAAELLSVSLDNSKTRVYSRITGLLVPADPNLESDVREKAQADLRQSALASGILNTAEGNARATLTTLLHSLGFQQITFR